MKTPIDQNGQPLSAYLLKILTILVKRAGGEIRIDATDMMDEPSGDSISKWYDRNKKQLVLSYLQPGSEVLTIIKSEEDKCPPSNLRNQRSSLVQPLHPSDLMDSSTSTLDDSRLADLEDFHRKQAAARLIANFPSTPVTEPRRQPLQQRPANQSPQERSVQRQFFRD